MANGTPEKIQVTQYKISGFNVVVTMPDGQQQVLKDGLADLMLGNIVLMDKNGDPISTDQILSNINLKQNALDSAFLGDFIRSKDENDNGADKSKIQQNTTQFELEQTIDQLRAQIKSLQSSNPQSEEIARLADENQVNQQRITDYLQQLQQARAEVVALKQTTEEKESIKQQLPNQNLAETFQSNQQQASTPDNNISTTPASSPVSAPSSSGQDATPTPPPAPLQPSSSSSAPPVTPGIVLADNQVVVDRDTLEKLEQEKSQAQAQADQAQADKAQAEADKAQAEADKQQAQDDKQKTDAVLTELGKAHFISPDLKITAKLDPTSDHGNGVAGSLKDNITNDTHPTIIGTATKSSTADNSVNTVTLLIYRDDNASAPVVPGEVARDASGGDAVSSGTQVLAATISIPESGDGTWKYDIPDTSSLTDGKYRYIATTNSVIDGVTKSGNPWVGDFTIDTVAPKAKLNSVTTAVLPDEKDHPNDWVTATSKPAFTGDTKPGSEVVLTLTPADSASSETAHTYKATSSTTGTWAIYVNTDEHNDELVGSNYNYTITVTDTAGNKSNTTGKLVVDTSDLKTTLELTPESDSGDSKTDWATNIQTPTFTGFATKNGKPAEHVHVQITVDGHTYKGDSNADGKWTIKADNAIANGTQIVLLHAKDDLGKEFTTSHIVFIDNTPPNINASLTYDSDTGDSRTDGITNNPAPSLHGTTKAVPIIISPGSGSPLPDTSPDASTSSSTSSASGTPDSSTTTDGTTVGPADADASTTPVTLVPAAPVVPTRTAPGAHIKLTIYYNPTGKGYFDTSGQSKVDEHSFKITKMITADTNGSWSFPVPTNEILAALKADATYNSDRNNQFVAHPTHALDGIYQYSVDITDTLGNHAATDTSKLLQWTIDTTPPADIKIAGLPAEHTDSTDPATKADPFASRTNTPTYNITTEPGSHILVTYQGADGVAGHATALANEKGEASVKFNTPLPLFVPNSAVQPTKVTITVTDPAGNSASKDVNMKYIPSIDLRLPLTASLTHNSANDTGAKQDDSITKNIRPEISGTTSAGAMVHLLIHTGGRTIKTDTIKADASGHWAIQPPSDLAEGITTFQAFASLNGVTGNTIGSLTVDTTAPTLDNFALGGHWLGNAVSQPADDNNNKPVLFNREIDTSDPTNIKITFSTSADMRQQSMASFTGTASESVASVLVNTLVGNKGPGNQGWKNYAEIHSASHNGRPIVAWAGGFNYDHNALSSGARAALHNVDPFKVLNGDLRGLPFSYNLGDLSWNENAIWGMGWRGYNGTWERQSFFKATDLAGNETIYTVVVKWNSNAPKIDTMTVSESNLTNSYDKDNPGVPLVGYSNSKTGFIVSGTATGAAKVYLVVIGKKANGDDYSETELVTKREQIVQDALAHKAGTVIIPGSITNDSKGNNTWSATYIANFRDGETHDIKVIPVLVNDTGRIQDYPNYIHITELSKTYNVSASLSEKDSLIAGGTTTNNPKPTFTGVIDHYDSSTGLTGTITIGGTKHVITITPPKPLTEDPDADQTKATWTFTPTTDITGTSTPYTVTITDKYGNSASTENQVSIGNLASGLAPADDTGVSDHDGITHNQAPTLIGKINAGDQVTVSYKLLDGTDTPHSIDSVTVHSDGSWTATMPAGTILKDGQYEFVASSTKDGRNTGTTTGHFIIDTTTPTVTTGVDTATITAQGVLNASSSNLFNGSPVLTGVVTTNDSIDAFKLNPFPNGGLPVTITVFVPNDSDSSTTSYVYTGVTDSTGKWTIPLNNSTITDQSLPPLPDSASYNYQVTVTDKAGNSSNPVSGTFGLDTTPPAPPQFGVKADHLHSTSGMNLITTSFTNSRLYGQAEKGDRIELSITGVGLPPIPPGSTDTSTITNPDGLPTPEKPLIFTSWTDPKTPEVVPKIQFDAENGKWNVTLDTLKDLLVTSNSGTSSEQNPNGAYYNVHIKVTDAAGNSTASDFRYQIGKNKPTSTIEVKKEDGGTLGIEHLTFESSPLFTGQTRPGATVTLNLSGTKDSGTADISGGDGSRTLTTTADDNGNWTISLKNNSVILKEGYYYYAVKVVDENNLQDTIGAKIIGGHDDNTKYFVRVNLAKVGTEESIQFDPKDDTGTVGDHISNDKTQHIVGKYSVLTNNISIYVSKDHPIDADHPSTLIPITNIIDDKTKTSIDLASNAGTWHVNFTDPTTGNTELSDGTYYIRAISTNTIGRTDIQDSHITIDTNPPTLNNVALATESDTGLVGDRLTSMKSPTLAGITKPGTTVTVHLINKDGHDSVQTTTADKDGNWKTTYHSLTDGKYTYWLQATDPAGNSATRGSGTRPETDDHFTIQSTFSATETVTISSQLDSSSDTGLQDHVTSNTTPTITGTATLIPNTGDSNRSKVFLDIEFGGVTHTYSGDNTGTAVGALGNYSIRITDPLPDGFYTYKVYTQDAAGNKSTVFDSPSNLNVTGTGGTVSRYAFKVQTTTPYEDTGIDGATTHNVTSSTAIVIAGKIPLQTGTQDKSSNYTVTVSATDFNQGSPLTRTASATIDNNGNWKSTTLNFTSYGVHNYTVTITDSKTGTTTSYTSPFTIQNSSLITLKSNTTEIEQNGSQPTFSGTTPETGVASLKLYVYDNNSKLISSPSGINITPDTSHNFTHRYTTPLADGHYTYKIVTVSAEGKESENPTYGVLEIWTTPPKLHYTEQDTGLHQGSNVAFGSETDQILFSGTLDLKNGKFADSDKLKSEETVSVKFKNFTLHPTTIDGTTGRWHITTKEYNDALAKAKESDPLIKDADNTAYTVTIQDRFKNTASDTGDLAPNNSHMGNISMPLFMGESEAGASITVIIISNRDKTILTSTTTADEKGHWDLTWSYPLETDTYSYSVQVKPTDSESYNTGQIGTFTISTYIPPISGTSDPAATPVSDTPVAVGAVDIPATTVEHSATTDDHTAAGVRTSRSLFNQLDDLIVLPRSMANSTYSPVVSSDGHLSPVNSGSPATNGSADSTHTVSTSNTPATSDPLASSNGGTDSAHTASTSNTSATSGSDTASTSGPLANNGSADSAHTTSTISPPSVTNTPLISIGSEHSDHPASTTVPAANSFAVTPPAITGVDPGVLPSGNNGLPATSSVASSTNSALSALLAHGTLLSPTGSAPASDLNTISAPKAASNDTAVSMAALEHTTTDHEHHHAA